MPLWAAVAVVAAAYALRSLLRGWDFRPDLPLDAILGACFAALVVARITVGRERDTTDHPGDAADEGADVERR
jgi:hypothetical protein